MQFSEQQLMTLMASYFLPFIRIGAVCLSMPVIGSRLLPTRVRLLLALAITFIVVPMAPVVKIPTDLGAYHLLWIVQESLLGLLIGFTFQLIFQVFVLGGQIIAMQSGLGFATMVDPNNQSQVPLVSQLYLFLVSLLFLALNGHLLLFELLANSFTTMPVGQWLPLLDNIGQVLTFSSWMFKGALLVALPAVIALLLVNLAFGVMTRAAPQLNIFAIGFPITLTLGVLIIYVTFSSVQAHVHSALGTGMLLAKQLLQVN